MRNVNGLLSYLENQLVKNLQTLKHPPVFIIGPPRSGTTLLYQLLVSRYRFVYFNNLTTYFYQAPILATRLSKPIFTRGQPRSFNSTHGRTQGWQAPNECGQFWYRWFPKGEHVYVPPGVTPASTLQELRQEVIGMSRVLDAPVLFKNTFNSMRIAPIIEALPEACFLVCRRNPVDIIQSILNMRLKKYGTMDKWLGVAPKEIDTIKDHPYWEQVTEQVYFIYQQIEDDKKRFGSTRFCNVSYEELCKATHNALRKVEEFFITCELRLQRCQEVPEQFPFSTGQNLDDQDYERIVTKVNELWKTLK